MRPRPVKLSIPQKCLRCIRPAFQEVLAGSSKPQMMLTHILQKSLAAKVTPALICRPNLNCSPLTVHIPRALARIRILKNSNPVTTAKGNFIIPSSCYQWRKMHPPLIAAVSRCLSRPAVRRVVPRRPDGPAALWMRKRHIQPIVQKRIRRGRLAGHGPVKCQRHFMPLLQFARNRRPRRSNRTNHQ